MHLSRHGIPYPSFATIEDDYSMATNWDLNSKWQAVQENLAKAATGHANETYLTYLTGSGGSLPYFVVSGKSSSGTHDPQLLTSPLPSKCSSTKYADFYQSSCKFGLKFVHFKGTNMMVNDLLANLIVQKRKQRVGIVVTDFPGGDLLSNIIAMNF